MIELPERLTQVRQINDALAGKTVVFVEAAHTPHGFAEYTGEPSSYPSLLEGKTVRGARYGHGELLIRIGDMDLLITTPIRYHPPGKKAPEKHQLLLRFDDGGQMTCAVAMWGSMLLFPPDAATRQGPDWLRAAAGRVCVSPLDDAFTLEHLRRLLPPGGKTVSVKALLATEQRISGVGNGVIQDVLFTAGLLPMRDARTLSVGEWQALHRALVAVVREMTARGGRDVEKDLFGNPGGYRTILSRKTAGKPCPKCAGVIVRKAYLGGNVYFCPHCQR